MTAEAHAKITMALAEAIHDLGQIPNGHLYAHIMDQLTLEEYTKSIEVLQELKLVRNQHDLLTWIGAS